jgi:hypothetical protein
MPGLRLVSAYSGTQALHFPGQAADQLIVAAKQLFYFTIVGHAFNRTHVFTS